MPTPCIDREEDVPSYTLPKVLAHHDGTPITTAGAWRLRRAELLEVFAREIYGHTPAEPVTMSVADEVTQEWLDGLAQLRQVTLTFRSRHGEARFQVAVVTPAVHARPVPVFIALNFWGNHAISPDLALREPQPAPGMEPRARGSSRDRWPLRDLVQAGFAVVTAWRGEIAPDHADHWRKGVAALFGPHAPGAIGLWSWALSRLLDYARQIPALDTRRAIALGHSRLGKAALWAAAQDERFAAAVSNDSGCLGAALCRRRFGETIETITDRFPYWFAPALHAYRGREDALPVDQHQLLALMAPRPLYVASASEDLGADPRGEYLAAREAALAYSIFQDVPHSALPEAGPAPGAGVVCGRVGYHLRVGPHNILAEDWGHFMRFAGSQLPPGVSDDAPASEA
ncbi:MAG: acetylxylan esterase [Opitutaceae bacterium]|nr:acetylxylan esterase [Opitutaceae bacterium]